MRYFLLCVMVAVGGPVFAESQQDKVLACFAGIGSTTEWNQCLNTMFAPCEEEAVGSEPHLECLISEGNTWRAAKETALSEVLEKLTEPGAGTLTGLLEAWPKFIDEKCIGIAEGRAQISFEAALVGCQISEYALMTNELTNCANGRSNEEYCQLKSE